MLVLREEMPVRVSYLNSLIPWLFLRKPEVSHFRCALCGKSSSIQLFDPTDFDLDIDIIQVRSRGRGKGFYPPEYVGSAFEKGEYPELLDKIIDRIEDLYVAFIQNEEADVEEEDEYEDDGVGESDDRAPPESPMDALDYELALGEREGLIEARTG